MKSLTPFISILLFSSVAYSSNLMADTKTKNNNSLQTSSQGFPVKWVIGVHGNKKAVCTMPGYRVYKQQSGKKLRCFKQLQDNWYIYIPRIPPAPPLRARWGSVNGLKQPICDKGYRVYKLNKIIPPQFACLSENVSEYIARQNYTLYIYK